MKSTTNVRRVVLSIIGVLLAVSVAAGTIGVQAAASKPGITVQISPASRSVVRGSDATYTVTFTSTGAFAGAVALSVSGLPGGSTPSFLPPTPLTLTATGATSTATSTLTVSVGSSTSVGSYAFSVTGTNGKVTGSVTAGLTVNASQPQPPGGLSMTATPASVTLAPGETAAYTIQLVRTNLTGKVTLSVISGLPTGASASAIFAPNLTTGNTSTLQVTTPETTKDDSYTLILGASGKDDFGVEQNASASVKLDINTKGKNFTISGGLTGLVPGLWQSLDLSLTNPNKKPLSVTNLSVTLKSVAQASGAVLPCTLSDYAVVQYSGPYPLVLPGSSTSTLSALGVASLQRPQIQLINKPGPDPANNQDGCKYAALSLSYSGSAQGN